ncbi:uncharacterized protein LOC134227759 [Armigeres subalbatus]|uniref:uncharacterized protein LOC134227759 n=1 Tax=Armigeres subalbatus TaxID=124917 RepID=UPI002ED42DD8
MLPSNQHQQQHPSSQQQQQQSAVSQAEQQHLLNAVGMSAAYTATSTSYSMSYPVVPGHHLNENNNLVMHPSYGKPAAHVAHQLPPASLITLQPVTLDGHHPSLHHVSGLGQPTHTITSLSQSGLGQQMMPSLAHASQQPPGSQMSGGMPGHSSSSISDPNGNDDGRSIRFSLLRVQFGYGFAEGVSASELILITAGVKTVGDGVNVFNRSPVPPGRTRFLI